METVVILSVVLLGNPFVIAANPKSGSTTPVTPKAASTSEAPIDSMDPLDYLRSGALAIGLLAAAFAGKETWMLADVILCGSFGAIWYFFPKPLLEYQTVGKLDTCHFFLCHVMGAWGLSVAVSSYYNRKSRSSGVHTAQFLTRLITGAVSLQAAGLDYMKAAADQQRLAPNYVTFGILGTALMVLVNLVYVIRSDSFGGARVNFRDRMSTHLLIDIVMYTVIGLSHFGFPEVSLSLVSLKGFTPDAIHAHLFRVIGAAAFGSGLYAFCALSFEDNQDKKNHFFCRLVAHTLGVVAMVLFHWQYGLFSFRMFLLSLGVTTIVVGNAACAYFDWGSKFGKSKRK